MTKYMSLAGKNMGKPMMSTRRKWMKRREGGNYGLARRKGRRAKVKRPLSDPHHEDTASGAHF